MRLYGFRAAFSSRGGIMDWKEIDKAILSASYVSYTKPFFTVIKMPEILEKSSFFFFLESKYVI